MEKKSTKIAYGVALAIVVVAMVIAKVANDGSGFVATGWALFPPVVAIALALILTEGTPVPPHRRPFLRPRTRKDLCRLP